MIVVLVVLLVVITALVARIVHLSRRLALTKSTQNIQHRILKGNGRVSKSHVLPDVGISSTDSKNAHLDIFIRRARVEMF